MGEEGASVVEERNTRREGMGREWEGRGKFKKKIQKSKKKKKLVGWEGPDEEERK